jgi:hypothetical protein
MALAAPHQIPRHLTVTRAELHSEHMQIFEELKRRNVIRVGAAYVVAAWLIIQVVETLFPIYERTA